ncbi:MAG: ABC transporter permease subunit [Fimbriimonadaceae bacterium]
MPLISKVGRKSPRARLAIVILYVVLCLGAVTTVYPFLLMVSMGMRGPTDQEQHQIIPQFLFDDEELFKKFTADKYATNQSWINSTRQGGEADEQTVQRYREFLMQLPNDYWVAGFRTAPTQVTSLLSQRYHQWLRQRYGSIDELNRAYIEENVAFRTVSPPFEPLERKRWVPLTSRKWEEWQEFKATLPYQYRVPVRAERLFQEFMRSRYRNTLEDVPAEVRGKATSFEEIQLPEEGAVLAEFRRDGLPDRYQDSTIEQLWEQFHGGPMPIDAEERQFMRENAASLRADFATRNFRYVVDTVAINGRALWNTFIFCSLAVGLVLIINPLAAYVLSRFPIRASGKILIFLLATMAFPAEVAMIPSFLLIKDMGLLNTFAALALPAAASGFTIFLLKGFFDSLPKELFESGQIDGANELTMMFRIALPLSKPVLGYVALIAFMGAYGAFLFAFLVAQDQSMWTLMVYIYQLQGSAPRTVMMAALTLASIPTLIVFLLAQRVIMRGIILPSER